MNQDNISFNFIPRKGAKFSESLSEMMHNETFRQFCYGNIGVALTVTVEHTISKSEKTRMYRYLNGPLLTAVMRAKRAAGDPKDKAECMLEMKILFAKDIKVVNGESHIIIMSQSDMTKQRLLIFIQDIIQHLEQEYGVEAPDSNEYLIKNL